MQKKRLLGLFLLSLVFLATIVQFVHFASAQQSQQPDPFSEVWNSYIKPSLTTWGTGNGLGDGFTRFLFGVIIGLLVYGIADRIPGMDKKELIWARGVIAIIIGFFGTSYISSGELKTLLVSYSALGFTLGFILPFLILVFFSYDIALSTNIKNVWVKRALIRVTWGVFGVFTIYKIIGLATPSTTLDSPIFKGILYVAFMIILGVFIFTNYLMRVLGEGEKLETLHQMANTVELSARFQQSEARAGKILADDKKAPGS